MPGPVGHHFVMPYRANDTGLTVYGVWYVTKFNGRRGGHGECEMLAEFRSQVLASRWCRDRNRKRSEGQG